jgi:hypothetical protein
MIKTFSIIIECAEGVIKEEVFGEDDEPMISLLEKRKDIEDFIVINCWMIKHKKIK